MNDGCEVFRERIARGLIEDLDGAEREALDDHLADCSECSREHREMHKTIDALRLLKDETPGRHFFVHPEPARSFGAFPPVWKAALAASILLLAAAVGLLVTRVHVRTENGVLMMSVGGTPEERWLRPLEESIVRTAVEAAREADREMAVRVGHEIMQFQDEVEGALIQVRDELYLQRREDLGLVRDHLDLVAAYDRRQDERTDEIVAAVNAMGRWDRP
ncbi:MAG: hypothetical protein R3344_03450 [Acidobacteriota bacterium]|nr:hypothetical protein [Acidobacteriota bacterium]